ncbi:hypothetical protein ACKKBF_B33850 [Auxenochlorella protothecoides x Auxenochlorella symbiontica]
MARKFFVGGNWKSNGTVKSVKALVESLNSFKVPGPEVVDVVVAPTFLHIPAVVDALRPEFKVAAQNSWVKGNGAYTGEITADQIADLGLEWVILGHSERRHIVKESDELTADKVAYALSKGLSVIFCIGEKLEEREANQTQEVNARQLQALADKISDWSKIVVAYEPVWAIGTGKVASPEQAQQAHAEIRAWLADKVGKDAAEATRIIYGGSVTASNSKDLAGAADIDGFLVGGASLKPEFEDIIKAAAK